jgi:PAS domain S-box-containing protein
MIKTTLASSTLPNVILKNVIFALVCLPLARLGVNFAFEGNNVSLVWPLSGISLAVLLLFGRDLWVGVWLGYFLHNLINGAPLVTCLGIATGSAAATYLAAYSLQKTVDFRPTFDRTRDVLYFIMFGVALNPAISALVGVSFLFVTRLIPPQNFAFDLFTWWSGDAMGVLVLTPALLIWNKVAFRLPSRRRWIEALLLVGALVIVCWVVFSQGFGPRSFYSLSYLIFPFLVWGALRFDARMVVTLTVIVSLIAVLQTGQQLGAFSRQMVWNSVLFLWAYIATMAITAMLLAATFTERRQAERMANSLEQRFSKAFHAAPVAIWIATPDEGIFIDANEELCTALGYLPSEVIGKSSIALNIWESAETRAQMLALLRQRGRLTQIDARLRAKSGELRSGLLSMEMIELDGEPRILNMFQDITARLGAEAALRESEAHYRQLFQGIDDAIFVHDLDANLLDVNEATSRRLGYSRDELLRMKITDLDTPEFASGYAERLQQQLAQGYLSNLEGARVSKDGRHIAVNVSTKVITYAGQPAILAVDRDMTERRLSEQKLRESEARYRAIVEDQTELICRIAPDSQVRFVNDAYCRYFGKTREELEGSYFRPNIHEADQRMVSDAFRNLSAENPVVNLELRIYRPDGKLRWHQMTDRAIIDEQGQVAEFQLVGKDITELKEMEAQRVAVAVEHEKVQILTDFIAAASHDFRTPLSVINTSAYLLKRVDDADQRDRHYKKIQEQTLHIERLVEGLLTMSRLDQGDVFRFRSAIQLNAVIQQIDARKRPQIDEKALTLALDLDPVLPPVEADETWLFRAVVQLLDNAIHYTPYGGTITIRTQALPNRVHVTISDTGVGINEEDLPHIFKRLYRGEGHRPVGGQGLGLSIAAKIVEAHHGRIEVESRPGEGSTFRIILPLKRSDTSVVSSPAL